MAWFIQHVITIQFNLLSDSGHSWRTRRSEPGPHSQLSRGFDLIREERALMGVSGFIKEADTRQDKTLAI